MTDYKALCAELLAVFDNYDDESNLVGIFDDMKANKIDLLDRARLALVPVTPVNGKVEVVLEATPAEPEPPKSCAVDPIPLSERKPGPEDRDHYGQCWWWGTSCTHRPAWVYASGWGTHWLPASTRYLPGRVEGPSDAEIAEQEPPGDETEFAWELQNASGDWQAGGSGNDLQIAQREGMRYLHQYSLDGEHTLIIRKHEITTISEVTYG